MIEKDNYIGEIVGMSLLTFAGYGLIYVRLGIYRMVQAEIILLVFTGTALYLLYLINKIEKEKRNWFMKTYDIFAALALFLVMGLSGAILFTIAMTALKIYHPVAHNVLMALMYVVCFCIMFSETKDIIKDFQKRRAEKHGEI